VSRALNWVETSRGDLALRHLEGVHDYGIDAVVTSRSGGVSAAPYDTLNLGDHVGDAPECVVENRGRVATAMGVDPDRLVISSQVHGAVVNDIDQWSGEPIVGDAMTTTRDDVALAVLVADCLALLVFDTRGPRIALVHAGWRGLRDHVIGATLSTFSELARVRVVIGPHISSARYQVGPEVARHFTGVVGALHDDEGDRHRLDLEAVALHQLAHASVKREHVTLSTASTDDVDHFFSDRAQRPCGRFGLVVRRRSYDSSAREGIQ
jgi:YfiH family protein